MRRCLYNRWSPPVGRAVRQGGVDFKIGAVSPVAVAFVQNENVANLHQSGFHRLNGIAGLRRKRHHGGVSRFDNIKLDLADSHSLNQYYRTSEPVHQIGCVFGGASQTAQGAPGGKRTDEDPRIKTDPVHADPVPQQGASGEWAGRIDGDNPQRFIDLQNQMNQLGD